MKRYLGFVFLMLVITASAWPNDTLHINRISPMPVNSDEQLIQNLGGEWLFHPSPGAGFQLQAKTDASWKKIEVPGEWTMQGFTVEKNKWAGYIRTFTVPATWNNKRIKLRCDGIYSESEIFINGKKVAEHLGGFTAFETDITALIKTGEQTLIAIRVKNESVADSLASGSKYAVHQLGGITRKIQLIALSEINVGQLHVSTLFDKLYKDAQLNTEIRIRNESGSKSQVAVVFELLSPAREKVFSKEEKINNGIAAGESIEREFSFPVTNPLKWDPEHPNLYKLTATIMIDGKPVEAVEKNVGFRQIEVRGNRVFVNNSPIKLRGVCRHEVMPLRGRSVNGNQWEEDVKIFRAGNVNYIRTSHYPPAEELLEACDKYGIFLEVEAPFCWAHETPVNEAQYIPALQTQTLDMVEFFRSHPSVLMWSLGNESMKYKEYFSKTGALVKQLDPTRPRIFSQWGPDADSNELEVGNHHYPGPIGPSQYANAKRPMVFDEYCHISAYNRFELVTDPGIRDAWGIGLAAMWEDMYKTPAILGGALWAGIDDSFVWQDTTAVGYGTWGPIDGWRREKPEYWHMKKTYSPVRILQKGNWENNGISLSVENRHLFSNINECKIEWQLGNQSGVVNADIAPGNTKDILISCKQPSPAEVLQIKVVDPRNVLVDEYAFKYIVPELVSSGEKMNTPVQSWTYSKQGQLIVAQSSGISIQFNQTSGALSVLKNKKEYINGLAQLMVLPLNGEGDGIQMTGKSQRFPSFTATAADRVLQKISFTQSPTAFTIQVWDSYREANGFTAYRFNANGTIDISYRYEINKAVNPRQWGLVFDLPSSFTTISWQRNGLWNVYPADHIGRLTGTAAALTGGKISGAAGPLTKPAAPWSQDRNELGSNDFRSTKMNIVKATLADKLNSITIRSGGSQHLRSWVEHNNIKVLIAAYSNMGSERFFRDHAALMDKPLKKGDVLEDNILIEIK